MMNITLRALLARMLFSSTLIAAESAYLLSYGWIPTLAYEAGKGYLVLWTSPPGYRKEHLGVHRSHAVNSQRASARLDAAGEGGTPAPAPESATPAPSSSETAPTSPEKPKRGRKPGSRNAPKATEAAPAEAARTNGSSSSAHAS